MKAFLTGSRAYGTPREASPFSTRSDIDLVCFVSFEDLATIVDAAGEYAQGSGREHNVSMRFGPLNLILLSDHRDYDLWKDGTEDLKERKPVTRSQAVHTFETLRAQREAERKRQQENAMPVSVSLYELARVPDSMAVLPEDFMAVYEPLVSDPTDKTRWGVIADWLDEHDEPLLASAFRYISQRPIQVVRMTGMVRSWYGFNHVPPTVQVQMSTVGFDDTTLLGAVAVLAAALDKARKETA